GGDVDEAEVEVVRPGRGRLRHRQAHRTRHGRAGREVGLAEDAGALGVAPVPVVVELEADAARAGAVVPDRDDGAEPTGGRGVGEVGGEELDVAARATTGRLAGGGAELLEAHAERTDEGGGARREV